ncbi:type IIL restriction-modification enzyme MmeI [Jannaschia formosa]|uniref:type IIL restriction-modification enzyme MmeI n=1 Tax=Jannaschia formosa TaxID=2259592 RepID=UPI003520E3AA
MAQGSRASHPGATPADLYDPDLMPADLRRAHRDTDRLYRRQGSATDRERVEHLFALYEAMPPARRRRRAQGRPRPAQGGLLTPLPRNPALAPLRRTRITPASPADHPSDPLDAARPAVHSAPRWGRSSVGRARRSQ